MSPLDAVLDDLAERVAAKVLAKLSAPSTHYGTGRAAVLPPGKSRAWALRNLKLVPGAKKVGRDWIVSVADFEAWLTERDTRRNVTPLRPANDAPDLLEESLRASGLRRIR